MVPPGPKCSFSNQIYPKIRYATLDVVIESYLVTSRSRNISTYKQRAANRANAQKSTGPKSKSGKSVSRANAYQHGLTAKQIVVPGETPEQFEKLREGLVADFAPGTTIEFELIDHLAALLLRRRRPPPTSP